VFKNFGEGRQLFGEDERLFGEGRQLFGEDERLFVEGRHLFGKDERLFGEGGSFLNNFWIPLYKPKFQESGAL